MIVKSQVKFSFALIFIHECLNKASMGVGRPVLAGVTWCTKSCPRTEARPGDYFQPQEEEAV